MKRKQIQVEIETSFKVDGPSLLSHLGHDCLGRVRIETATQVAILQWIFLSYDSTIR
jgi:hypothetical protein